MERKKRQNGIGVTVFYDIKNRPVICFSPVDLYLAEVPAEKNAIRIPCGGFSILIKARLRYAVRRDPEAFFPFEMRYGHAVGREKRNPRSRRTGAVKIFTNGFPLEFFCRDGRDIGFTERLGTTRAYLP